MQLSREMALFFLNDIENQLENIVSISLAALAYQETLSDETRSVIADNLFGVIRDEADRSTALNELRELLAERIGGTTSGRPGAAPATREAPPRGPEEEP